jgi:hypothetical protein
MFQNLNSIGVKMVKWWNIYMEWQGQKKTISDRNDNLKTLAMCTQTKQDMLT